MKRLLLTILCVLFAYPCFAAEPIQLARMNPWVAGSVAANSCSSGTTDVDTGITNDTSSKITTTAMGGHSFQVATNGIHLYSITLSIYGNDSVNANMILRYGNSENLGTYYKQVTKAVNIVNGWQTVEIIIADTDHTLSTGTTYYFMVHTNETSENIRWGWSAETNTYADGNAYFTTSDASDWDLTGHGDPYDSFLIIKRCD